MILALIILIPFLCITIWLYLKFSPHHTNGNIIRNYNIIVIILALTACLLVSLYFYNTTGQSVDRAWWPVLAFFGSLFILPTIVLIGGIIRNLIIPVIERYNRKR